MSTHSDLDPIASAAAGSRRRRLSEATRRAQIITGCVEVVARDGYEHASLTRIAQAAGVSKGLITHYFGERDTLMEETAIATVATVRDSVAARVDLAASVPDIIAAAVHHAAHLTTTHGADLSAADQIARNLRHPDGTPRLDLTIYEETYQAQERLFRRGQTEGSLSDFDTRVMAVTYQGALTTMITYLRAHPDADVDEYASSLVDILLRAVGGQGWVRPTSPTECAGRTG